MAGIVSAVCQKESMSDQFDVAIIGAGAAGMMCAGMAGQRGLRVVLIDHAPHLAEKIRISGGGRCNFTNINASYQNYLSENPHFCRSALSRYTPQDFLQLMQKHHIRWHEKHKGQLFCDGSSEDVIGMLQKECELGDVQWRMPCDVRKVTREGEGFGIDSSHGKITARHLVIATGGLSIPKIGATDFAYKIAAQFDLQVVAPRPGLVPLTFEHWERFGALAGLSLPVAVEAGSGKTKGTFLEDLLFTHKGLSGPAILQISSYWRAGEKIKINLLPEVDVTSELVNGKTTLRKNLGNILSQWLPSRLAEGWLDYLGMDPASRIADMPNKTLEAIGSSLNHWVVHPGGSEGYRKAEVTLGGVDTRELSQQDMMAKKVPGLHFIGESVDVTGWLGGYNFQWAWASAAACARSINK